MRFKELSIKLAWIELIKNIKDETKNWDDIKTTRKG